jgi:spore coat polysaccharide biosynthesis protein SpsF (cytidylyltransferase family)
VKIAESEKINVIRGSEEYPAKRILENQRVLKTYRFICRICGDSPFYNFNVPLKAMRLAAQECQNMPLVISTTQRRCLPSGLSVEIYERKGLIERLAKSKEYQELEHLSEIIAKGYITSDAVWEIVPTGGFRADMQTKLTIDTWEDLEHIRKMLRAGADKSIKDYYSKVGLRLERFVR